MTPEQLQALVELIKAVDAGSVPAPRNETEFYHGLRAAGDFIRDSGWPIVVLIGLVLFKKRIRSLKSPWGEVSFDSEVAEVGERAEKVVEATSSTSSRSTASEEPERASSLGSVPSSEELATAGKIEALARRTDAAGIREEAEKLANEYERTRASLPPGDERTRRMEVIVAKMRAIGRAVFSLRHEFMKAESPGFRLIAITSLQVNPDYEALNWLVDRVTTEKPFIGYHAAVALLVAARDPARASYKTELRRIRPKARDARIALPPDSDRAETLGMFEKAVEGFEHEDG